MTAWRLVCDIGGTNVRMARCEQPNHLSHLTIIPTQVSIPLGEVLRTYSRQFDDHADLDGVAIAAAGPVDSGRVVLTNRPLNIESNDISAVFDGKPVLLLNDLQAAAQALPFLNGEDIQPVLKAASLVCGPRLIANVGTGFGAALLVQTSAGWHSIATEAGHMTLGEIGGSDPLRPLTVSVEDKISGRALASNLAFTEEFGALLGSVCGNLVLATGAWGGVYLCGSVASAWCRTGHFSSFATAFRMKGPMSRRMVQVPVTEIIHPQPALVGLTTVALG